MRISGFIWLESILDKLWEKHQVELEEVESIFRSGPHYRFVERGFRQNEDVYAAMGQTEAGRYLIVFFILKRDFRALIVSARDMRKSERKRYEQR